jgi:hypothetical protein
VEPSEVLPSSASVRPSRSRSRSPGPENPAGEPSWRSTIVGGGGPASGARTKSFSVVSSSSTSTACPSAVSRTSSIPSPMPIAISVGPDQVTPSADVKAQTDSSGSSSTSSRPTTMASRPSRARRTMNGRLAREMSESATGAWHVRTPGGIAQ